MIRRLRRTRIFITVGTIGLLAMSVGAGTIPMAQAQNEATLTHSAAFTSDQTEESRGVSAEAELLRDSFGIPPSVAEQWVQTLVKLGESQASLASTDPNFVALEAPPGKELVVDYLTTAESIPESAVTTLLGTGVSHDQIRVQTVHADKEQIEQAKLKASELAGPNADVSADLKSGTVTVTQAEPMRPEGLPENMGAVQINWTQGEVFEDAVAGGKPWGTCTGGFIVKMISSGARGMSTAAHCAVQGILYGGGGTYTGGAGLNSGAYDVRFYSPNTSVTLNNAVACCGTGAIPITGRRTVGEMMVGQSLCIMGRTSGYQCGFIREVGYHYDGSSTFVRYGSVYPIAAQGDSGGPVFTGNQALGWITAANPSGEGLFMPQQYSRDLGFTVAAS